MINTDIPKTTVSGDTIYGENYFSYLWRYKTIITEEYMKIYNVSKRVASFMIDWSLCNHRILSRVLNAMTIAIDNLKQ